MGGSCTCPAVCWGSLMILSFPCVCLDNWTLFIRLVSECSYKLNHLDSSNWHIFLIHKNSWYVLTLTWKEGNASWGNKIPIYPMRKCLKGSGTWKARQRKVSFMPCCIHTNKCSFLNISVSICQKPWSGAISVWYKNEGESIWMFSWRVEINICSVSVLN